MVPGTQTRWRHRASLHRSCLPALLLGLAAITALSPQTFVSTSLLCRRSFAIPARAPGRGGGVCTALASRGGEAEEESFVVGDRVLAVSSEDEQRYPGTVDAANSDGTFTVRWDDPDSGPETEDIAPGRMKKVVIFKDYVVGDDVLAFLPEDEDWYAGTVDEIKDDGTFSVKWDDPGGGPETGTLKPEDMRKVTVFRDYRVNDVVEATFPDDGVMYPGTVVKVNGDGTFQVKWDNSEGGDEESTIGPKFMKFPRIPVDKLQVGQKYIGQVRAIMEFGAFVDIGADDDGLLHISRIAKEPVDNVRDYLDEMQEVEVWVCGTREDGKFSLTMIEGLVESRRDVDLTPFQNISPDTWLTGMVAATRPFGAFVSVTLPDGGPTASGLVHISELKDGAFIKNVEDEVHIGQVVQVRVRSADSGKLSLSMRQAGSSDGGVVRRKRPDLSFFEMASRDEQRFLTGKVARTAPFGAFVTVTADDGSTVDGLVHITQIRDGFVENIAEELNIGKEVQVRVLSVDTEDGKVNLSMKPPDYV